MAAGIHRSGTRPEGGSFLAPAIATPGLTTLGAGHCLVSRSLPSEMLPSASEATTCRSKSMRLGRPRSQLAKVQMQELMQARKAEQSTLTIDGEFSVPPSRTSGGIPPSANGRTLAQSLSGTGATPAHSYIGMSTPLADMTWLITISFCPLHHGATTSLRSMEKRIRSISRLTSTMVRGSRSAKRASDSLSARLSESPYPGGYPTAGSRGGGGAVASPKTTIPVVGDVSFTVTRSEPDRNANRSMYPVQSSVPFAASA